MFLNNHTYYSLKYGTLSPKQLVAAAATLGIKSLVLTDINNCSCAYQFILECEKHKIKPVLGIEFRRDHRFLYTGIAKNREGWKELCCHLTEYSLNQVLEHCGFEDIQIIPLNLYVFFKNPLNYVAWFAAGLLTLIFRLAFTLYGKKNKTFTKKFGAVGTKRA